MLQVILGEWLAERERKKEAGRQEPPADQPDRPAEQTTPPEDGLGHILFERRSDAAPTTLAVLAVLFFVGAVVLLALGDLRPFAAVVGVLGVVLAVAAKRTPPSIFRCHKIGVFRSGAGGETQIRYGEIRSFSYHGTRHFVNGSYTGTTIQMTFDAPNTSISYGTSVSDPDSDLDGLRDHISNVVAARMCRQLADGETVTWTYDLAFQPDAIRYTPRGFFGNKELVGPKY